ncbi:MAG TPA: Ig-like domain-containing protein [Elusimicrobiota bacterium]|nr:Ig-like domain-containing protein [Elusimicrobiota bacterium]
MKRLRLLAALTLSRAASAASAPAAPAAPPPPTVSIAAPAAGARLAGTVALSAAAAPPGQADGVQFQLDGADLGPRISSRPFTALWNTAGTPDGTHLLTAEVFGRDGRTSSSDAVPVVVDNQPVLIGGVAVSGISAAGATISFTTSKPAEGQVEYGPTTAYGASTVLESGESASHSAVLTGLTPGTTYHFRAAAEAGSRPRVESEDGSFATPAVSTGGAPPAVAIMNPAPGALVSGTISVSANAAGSSPVASVQFMADGTELGPPVTAAPFVFSWNTASVPDGQHALSAIAVDAAGVSATAVVTVTVANAPPVISGIAVSGLGGDRADVLWTTDQRADSAVSFGTSTLYGASTPVNPAQSTGHGVALRGLIPGTQYHYVAKSRDAAGVLAVSDDQTFTTAGSTSSAAPGITVPAAGPDLSVVKAPQKFLTPATADGVNDQAVFGPGAREVTIFDIRGHKVFHGTSSGPGSPVVWDCKDGSGRVVTAGVYLAKIVARDSSTAYQSFAVAK